MLLRITFVFSLLIALAACQFNPLLEQAENSSAMIVEQQAPTNVELFTADPNCSLPQTNPFQLGPYSSLWDRLRAGYALGKHNHPRLNSYLKYYGNNPSYMARVSERAHRYLFHIVEELEAADMPLEIALLPIVESAFDPFAYSHGRAAGMWQFIPATGQRFGMKKSWWYDGRRDVLNSTRGAVKYLKYLHKYFDGDWLLALAAYNSGEGNVKKSIRRNKQRGKPTDFWSLDLPRETRAYVPQLIAISQIVYAPENYPITLQEIPNQAHFTVVDIDSQLDLAQAADMADISVDELYLLNPGFSRWATDPEGPHRLLIPVANAERFNKQLEAVPLHERLGWRRYTVKRGDTLGEIAEHFGLTSQTLKRHNDLRSNRINIGQELIIPVAQGDAKDYALSAEERLKTIQRRSKGDQGTSKITYVVKAGDSFWAIAQRYKVTPKQIASWNGMAPKDPLRVGRKLIIWAEASRITQVYQQRRQGKDVVRKINYKVRRGDSLGRIANKFKLGIDTIAKWNDLDKTKYLQPGQRLTLYVDVMEAR